VAATAAAATIIAIKKKLAWTLLAASLPTYKEQS